jgi:hypothetical protein
MLIVDLILIRLSKVFKYENLNNRKYSFYRCSKEQLPLYQVQGLAKSVYLANVASGPTTMISFDGGINWNKTHYECDKVFRQVCYGFCF